MKKQICSYDMVAVPSSSYTVTDAEGEMYLCNEKEAEFILETLE
jgi:hypothetical protein